MEFHRYQKYAGNWGSFTNKINMGNNMKTYFIKNTLIITILFLGVWRCNSQSFINLDFESAVIISDPSSPYYPSAVFASGAIPGWTATGFIGPSDILYNSASLGSTSVSILATNGFPPAIDGAFSVLLYGGDTATSASISQTAMVPLSAQSILFKAQGSGGTLLVSLGGQNISFFALSTGANYTLYGGNISVFAGQSEQLMFSALTGENFWNIDDIQFSSSPIPEPDEFALTVLGGLLLGFRRWRKFLAMKIWAFNFLSS